MIRLVVPAVMAAISVALYLFYFTPEPERECVEWATKTEQVPMYIDGKITNVEMTRTHCMEWVI